jgi:hypothetical protein
MVAGLLLFLLVVDHWHGFLIDFPRPDTIPKNILWVLERHFGMPQSLAIGYPFKVSEAAPQTWFYSREITTQA